jgi:hypothetical protein
MRPNVLLLMPVPSLMRDWLIAVRGTILMALAFAALVSLFMPWRWHEVTW